MGQRQLWAHKEAQASVGNMLLDDGFVRLSNYEVHFIIQPMSAVGLRVRGNAFLDGGLKQCFKFEVHQIVGAMSAVNPKASCT
jgi:hypothetical protein